MEFDSKKFTALRERMGTQQALGKKLKLHHSTIAGYEMGRIAPPPAKWRAIADALGCSVSDFCNGEPLRACPSILQGVIDFWDCLTWDEQLDIAGIVRAARDRAALKKKVAKK